MACTAGSAHFDGPGGRDGPDPNGFVQHGNTVTPPQHVGDPLKRDESNARHRSHNTDIFSCSWCSNFIELPLFSPTAFQLTANKRSDTPPGTRPCLSNHPVASSGLALATP